jgi:hypothetical protein
MNRELVRGRILEIGTIPVLRASSAEMALLASRVTAIREMRAP